MNPAHSHPFTSRFLQSCESYPERTALCKEEKSYSYQELKMYVQEIMALICREADSEKRIGVADQNDVYTYASFIAINLLGKTWVPLSLQLPEARRNQYIQETQVHVVLSSLPFSCLKSVKVLDATCARNTGDLTIQVPDSTTEPAYILFTSGSTGTPKGVPVHNKQLNAFFDFFGNKTNYIFLPDDRFLQVYDAGFDVSVFSAFMPLFCGAATVLLPRRRLIWQEIPVALKEENITVLSMVPSALYYLEKYMPEFQFKTLRYSFFSGEKLHQRLAELWSACVPQAKLVNCYGPAETTIVCTHYAWIPGLSRAEAYKGIVPLGKSFPGMEDLIVDEALQEASEGESGELCFTGEQVIEAYLGRAGEEKFFLHKKNGKRYYRTGDHVKRNSNGNLLFLGRTDEQLKINGYRVEPAEIESTLGVLTGNKRAFIIPANQDTGIPALLAFVEGEGDEQSLIHALKERLPAAFIPKRIFFIDKWPMTLNGKTDRQELLRFAGVPV